MTTDVESSTVETLDDIINEFNIAPAPAPVEPQAIEKPVVPIQTIDPFDSAQLSQYFQNQQRTTETLNSQLQNLNSKLSQIEQEKQQSKVEADIQSTVDSISKKVEGIPKGIIEYHLEKTARENPAFLKIWENRHSNKKAFEKALTYVTNDIAKEYSVQTSPELVKNQQIVTHSQQSRSNSSDPIQDQFDNASFEEREALRQRMLRSAY